MEIRTDNGGGSDLATLFRVGAMGQLADVDLLARFADGRRNSGSEAAFGAIVARHGPMVLGVCRRVLGDSHAADDAFQATFLILTRKAASVRFEGSLAPWLFGVGVRVARRAGAQLRRERARVRTFDGFDPPDPVAPDGLDDLRSAIDEEIARLPSRYRSAAVLCWLEGLTQEQAAERLGCPVGTVWSRLHRARTRLRSALARRGFAPANWEPSPTARVDLSPALIAVTLARAIRPSAIPAVVEALAFLTIREMLMIQGIKFGSMLAALGLSATGAVALAFAANDQGEGVVRQPAPAASAPKADPKPPESSVADRLAGIIAEYKAKDRALWDAVEGAKNQRERNDIYGTMAPDTTTYSRRVVDLVAANPAGPAARDALGWVIRHSGSGLKGAYSDEFARAAALLVRHHGDDPDAVRLGIGLGSGPSPARDLLVYGFYASADGREAQGLARLALADYLELKSSFVGPRNDKGRQTITYHGVIGDDGKPFDLKKPQTDEEYAYRIQFNASDRNAVRAEAERLYEEVIAEYGDVPYDATHDRQLEAALKMPTPIWKGKPMTADARRKAEQRLANRPTLAGVSRDRLDALRNLVVGKPAPEIVGVDFEGKPLKLSDYRGKVVVLVFWGTWCGPCMREIPHERELVERFKDKPFALLGVNCDEEKNAAIKAIASERINWPNWHDGAPGEGPIASLYHIQGYPTCLVIDADGIIRQTNTLRMELEKTVEGLLDGMKSPKPPEVPAPG